MFSHDETIQAVYGFYRLLVSLAYPDESVLKVPPAEGWDNLNIAELRKLGKNDTVIRLLKHLPYLSPEDPYSPLLVHYETISRDYTATWRWHDEIWPIPGHCVYLTESVDSMGYSLILDTERGTITEFTGQGSHMMIPYEDEQKLQESEKWRAHRTTPVVDFFTAWEIRYDNLIWMLVPGPFSGPTTGRFYARASHESEEDELIGRGLVAWSPAHDERSHGSQSDRDHVKDVYDTFLRNGWPTDFRKKACKAELFALERRRAGLPLVDEPKVRKATAGPFPKPRLVTAPASTVNTSDEMASGILPHQRA